MYAPRVFISMLGALIVFAIATYALTGSISMTFWQTVISAVLLQIGYFIGVLFLVSRAARNKRLAETAEHPPKTDQDATKSNGIPAARLTAPEHSKL